MRCRALVSAAVIGSAMLVGPGQASAHGLIGREDLPVPDWLFGWAASTVLIISFVALGFLWRSPQLEKAQARPLFRLPLILEPLCGAIGVAVFAGLLYTGFDGVQSPQDNLLPTVVYVLFWAALVPISAMFGNVFRVFNPWRAFVRGCGWLIGRIRPNVQPLLTYPERLGRWPAVAGLVAFGWLELIAHNRDGPALLATLALVYGSIQVVGMALFGIEKWTDRADTFSVLFSIFSGISAFTVVDGQFAVRRPFSALSKMEWLPGTVFMICAAIGITAFDGASQGKLWLDTAAQLQSLLEGIGFSAPISLQIASTIGLCLAIALISGFYRLGVSGISSVDTSKTSVQLRQLFAHSLVPIALAYVVAHYFSLLVFQGQATAYLVSDPLGNGSDLLGTAQATVNYGLISATGIWYVQVGALIVGHIAGLALAHDRALVMFPNSKMAMRSQYWMLVVMVGFTSLGLWLLAQANA